MINDTLIVDASSSRCANCGRPALPTEATHRSVPGARGSLEGCGIIWTKVTSYYQGPGIKEALTAMRPDLQWVGP